MTETDETPQQAFERGKVEGHSLGSDIVLRVILSHLIATADDPIETHRQLQAAAANFAKGLNDGTGVDGPRIEGVRAGALEGIASYFVADKPQARQ